MLVCRLVSEILKYIILYVFVFQVNPDINSIKPYITVLMKTLYIQISRHLELIFMQNNRREIQPPQEKEDDECTKEDSGDTEKEKSTADVDENAAEDDLKERLDADDEKEEITIGDDGNWKRAKKRDDEDEDGNS